MNERNHNSKTVNRFLTPVTTEVPELLTVAKFCNKYDFISEGGLRYQIFNRKNNGLEKSEAIIKLGKKIIINVPKYFDWVLGGN